ncbi:MAG TPA: TIGR02680 family protein [Lachnospiraceae bacterium]|nr:TIGR02680 family protein [Lachnospiraceae bacterium]
MNNSNWIINKVGLIDFWYYDQQEFTFLDGRMLLRGSNGSGKSVTMQSFIPLLLDGNMRPERLDPFGSRARKMENYLLDEDDTREERTGYLYMEFKRTESDTYTTVGIGMRARKNKKLETWYFCITDGRRIGSDFLLYKDVQHKIAYSKLELRNRIGSGGRVMDTQGEYASCVNSLIFGFETVEEYKEMLDLLIQLRTPKLSKDFKPSVINDILSKSLQTLSEDDLRPMSEAIENMDTTKTNLDNLSESIKAAKQIEKVYDQYNKAVLLEKAQLYLEAVNKYDKQEKEIGLLSDEISQNEKELKDENEHYAALKQEYEILEEERNSLSDSDATRLKAEETKIVSQIAEYETEIKNYEKRSDKKREECIETENRIKSQADENEAVWQDIENTLINMEEAIENIPFDEAYFFMEEIKNNKEAKCNFPSHIKMLDKYTQKVENGYSILRQEEEAKRRCDEALKELDLKKEEREKAEREWRQYERQLIEQKNEFTEAIYIWERSNTELSIDPVQMHKIAGFIDNYQYGMDYSKVKSILRDQKNASEDNLYIQERKLLQKKEPLDAQLKETVQELKTWEQSREPEPARSPEVVKNRQKLDEMHIAYKPFYKTVDFADNLSSEEAGRLEAALLNMGILDALIVDTKDREKIFALDGELCDKYLFGDAGHIEQNITEVLQVYNTDGDMLLYQNVSGILAGIGYNSSYCSSNGNGQETYTSLSGHYHIGIVEGTSSTNYKAKFIGTAARERYRLEKIEELKEQVLDLEKQTEELEKCILDIKAKQRILSEELEKFPDEEDLKIAAKDLWDSNNRFEKTKSLAEQYRERLEKEQEKLKEIRIKVQETCAGTHLANRLDIFESALSGLRKYRHYIQEAGIFYNSYWSGTGMIKTLQDSLQGLLEDRDEILYALNQQNQRKTRLLAELKSVRKQLGLTNYDEIKERLDKCVKRLDEIPVERDNTASRIGFLNNAVESGKEKRDKQLEQLKTSKQIKDARAKVFLTEHALGYIVPDKNPDEDAETKAKNICGLAGRQNIKPQLSLLADLQAVFHEKKGFLTDYNLTTCSIFTDQKIFTGDGTEVDILTLGIYMERMDIKTNYKGVPLPFKELITKLQQDLKDLGRLLSENDRELFENILSNTIVKKIRAKIYESQRWVKKMNDLMESMQTSSGLKLSLKWISKKSEKEGQLDTKDLVELLQSDKEILNDEDVERMASHFRSKITEARKMLEDTDSILSFHMIMKDILDYRQWFEFRLYSQKTGEKKRELTDRIFFTFSGGEKAMSMYVPLFSAVVAKYAGADKDAPMLISLDEAFAGVDEMNIKDMFRLMVSLDLNFMINSQVLWGDYETVPQLAIYQLVRPENAKYVTVIPYIWNGKTRTLADKT